MTLADDIKSRINILDIIGKHVILKKHGKKYTGKCPFHTEKTASFNVDPINQFYKCFGCGNGGDVIKFVMDYDQLNFNEALEKLAGSASNISRSIPINQQVKALERAGRPVAALELAQRSKQVKDA